MIRLVMVENQESVMEGIGMLDGQHWVLTVELGYVCRRQFCVAEGMDFHGYARSLFRQKVKCADVHITVNENDILRGLLYQACQQAERIVDLPVKKYLLAGFGMGVNEIEYLLEFFVGFLLIGELLQFHSFDTFEHMGVTGDEYESIHDAYADIYGDFAAEDCRQHGYALLGEGIGRDTPPTMCGT